MLGELFSGRTATLRGNVLGMGASRLRLRPHADEILEQVRRKKRVAAGKPFLRDLLLEGRGGLLKKKFPIMRTCPQNRIAWGDTLRAGDEPDVFIETLTGLNDHVNYLHTKYMLIDPLSDDPVVITGSANFSEASTIYNDENMVIIRGDTRVADIFLGEFMRLFNHFHQGRVGFRENVYFASLVGVFSGYLFEFVQVS